MNRIAQVGNFVFARVAGPTHGNDAAFGVVTAISGEYLSVEGPSTFVSCLVHGAVVIPPEDQTPQEKAMIVIMSR